MWNNPTVSLRQAKFSIKETSLLMRFKSYPQDNLFNNSIILLVSYKCLIASMCIHFPTDFKFYQYNYNSYLSLQC